MDTNTDRKAGFNENKKENTCGDLLHDIVSSFRMRKYIGGDGRA